MYAIYYIDLYGHSFHEVMPADIFEEYHRYAFMCLSYFMIPGTVNL